MTETAAMAKDEGLKVSSASVSTCLFRTLTNVPDDHLFNVWWDAILALYEYGQVGRHEATRLRETLSPLAAMARARKIEAAMFDFLLHTRSDPFIKVMGSASDDASNAPYSEPAKQTFRLLLERTVPRGLCLGNGGASTGFMGFSSRLFEQVRAQFGVVDNSLSPRLAVVPLLPRNPENWREPKFTPKHPVDLSSPPQMLFQTRTPLLFGFGQVLAILYFAGGFGTKEEESVNDLAVQLRNDICTLFSHLDPRLLPPSIFMDEWDGHEWEWESRVSFFERILRKSTAKRASFQPFYVLRPCQPPALRNGKFHARARDFFHIGSEDQVGLFFDDPHSTDPLVQDWNQSGCRVVYGSPEVLAAFTHRLLVQRYLLIEQTYRDWSVK